MFCRKCGTKVESNAHFCAKCGVPLVRNATSKNYNDRMRGDSTKSVRSEFPENPPLAVIHKCRKCGYPMTAEQQVCPHCRDGLPQETKVLGMKYHFFTVYISLIAVAVSYAISALQLLSGFGREIYADYVYDEFPLMETVDILYAVLLLGLAVMALVVRNALKYKKSNAMRSLLTLDIMQLLLSTAYNAILLFGMREADEEILFALLVFSVASVFAKFVFTVIDCIYYSRRRKLFIN